MQFVWCAAQKVRRPNDGLQTPHIECGEALQAEVGTALALRDNSIRTSVRKVSGATDRNGACRPPYWGGVDPVAPFGEEIPHPRSCDPGLYRGPVCRPWLEHPKQGAAEASSGFDHHYFGEVRSFAPLGSHRALQREDRQQGNGSQGCCDP